MAYPFFGKSASQSTPGYAAFNLHHQDSAIALVVALFDNGETLPIYKIPLVTFANFNGLTAKTGNVYVSSDSSGAPVLRIAKTGSAGAINAGSLENSTVDLGTEFTNMILAQRAYSATTRIIITADEMLDELVRIKR